MPCINADFLVIGGGVIGINMAILARKRYPDCNVILIEKEPDIGIHASGRNSGVLHAGFYYTNDSLKAKFTRDGNSALTNYCLENSLNINRCGKLVVAKNEAELNTLDILHNRGEHNQVEIYKITEKEAKEIEPRVKTYENALWSPTTSSVDPKQVMASLLKDAKSLGVTILPNTTFLKKTKDGIKTNNGFINAGYVINSAGLYADKIAKEYEFSQNHTILPFKGLYLIGSEQPGSIRTNIYPVPDLNNPFLGVHFTIAVNGKIKLGPTAIPAFWREHYNGFENFNLKELADITLKEISLFFRNEFGFRDLALVEMLKYLRPYMVKQGSRIAENIEIKNYKSRGPAGIRAQLFNTEKRKLEMDFIYEGDSASFHILNAVSPAFTCSIPFSQYMFDKIDNYLSRH